jgi:Flp pilus assembly protein TadG
MSVRVRSERGQSVVMVVVFMVALLGMAAVAIDVGSWYWTKRQVQAAADASALAGASRLPEGWSYAQTSAASQYSKNGKIGDAVLYQNTTTLAANDTVKVTATRTSESYFAQLFGIASADITATASATIKSYTGVTSTGQVMPWGIMKASWVLGSSYSIYTDGTSPNNGALSLSVKDSSGNCQSTSGGSDYKNSILGPSNLGNAVCDVHVGDLVDVKTGQNTGPTKQGIDGRLTSWQPLSSIVTLGANGQATLLQPNSPQLVVLPVVEDISGGTAWPSGSGKVRIVGFAYFVILQPGYTNGGKTVVGTFVGIQGPQTGWITGAYNPTNSTASTIEMTG